MSQQTTTQEKSGFDLTDYVVPLVFACLVFVPVLYYGLDSELARWKSARSQLLYEEGEIQDSINMMRTAVEQAPHDLDLQLELAEKLMMHQRAEEALEIVDEVAALSVDPLPALRSKAQCLMYLGRSKEALSVVKSLSDHIMPEEFGEPARLNELAYFRGLANSELKEAQEDIQSAIEIVQRRQWWDVNYPMPLEDQALVALGLVARTVNACEQVVPILDERIEYYHDLHQKTLNRISSNVYLLFDHDFPLDTHQEEIIRHSQIQLYSMRRDCALLLAVRALIYQQLNQIDKYYSDRMMIVELEQDAEKLVDVIPDDWHLMNLMMRSAVVLDTRAVVNMSRGDRLSNAAHDLNVAVLAIEVLSKTYDGSMQNTIRDETGDQFSPSELNRLEAVLRLHRAQLFQRMDLKAEAETDFQKMEELGFDRNEKLF